MTHAGGFSRTGSQSYLPVGEVRPLRPGRDGERRRQAPPSRNRGPQVAKRRARQATTRGTGHGPARAFARAHASTRFLARPVLRGLGRLLAVWLLAYVLLLQSVLGAAAMAAASVPGGGLGGVLCLATASGPDADGSGPHDGERGMHCAVCPAAGGVPPLPPAPALPHRFDALTDEAPAWPATRIPAPPPAGDHARPRAPPAA